MTKSVKVGNLTIGGGAPVSVQSMTDTPTTDIKATVGEIEALQRAGADLVRVSVPDQASAKALKSIVEATTLPIVADIHYDYRLAIAAMESGAHKIRINPSNTPAAGLKEIAQVANERLIPIRVGVNRGSVKEHATPEMLAALALDAAKRMEDAGCDRLVLAVKSSDVRETVAVNRILAKKTDYPLHIGLTEAGTPQSGMIRSSAAIGALLLEGIGDTVRFSLSGNPVPEVIGAVRLLQSLGLREGVHVVACPTCARTCIDVAGLAERLERRFGNLPKNLKIAVMGCAVNGIGESQGADFGVCGGKDKSILFRKGQIVKTVGNDCIEAELDALLEECGG